MGYNFMIKPDWLLYDLIFALAERHNNEHYPWIIVFGRQPYYLTPSPYYPN